MIFRVGADMDVIFVDYSKETPEIIQLLTAILILSFLSDVIKIFSRAPCGKFRKYFQMRQLSENTFQSFNMEVYEKIFF